MTEFQGPHIWEVRRQTKKRKQKSSQRREWRESNVSKVNGQEGVKKCCITDEDSELDKTTRLGN